MIFIIKNNFFSLLFFTLFIFTLFSSCEKEKEEESPPSLNIEFTHFVDLAPVGFSNDICCINAAYNPYGVRRVLYVISDITLYFSNNSPILLEEFIFVNSEDLETLFHEIDDLPELCSGISFRLGFSTEDNIDNAYLNSSNQFHDNMVWPNSFGQSSSLINQPGGYHYMKLEGKYLNGYEEEVFYNNHTGPTNGEDYSVLYSQFNFTPSESILIKMHINNFYNNPIYDMNNFGGAIMENSNAQIILSENAYDVFTVESK